MKASRIRIRSLLIVIALVALIMAGVAKVLKRPGRPYSKVFSGLQPVELFCSQPGYSINSSVTWDVINTTRRYAFKEWRGVVTVPNDPQVRQTFEKAIEDYMVKVSQGRCHTEGSLPPEPHQMSRFGPCFPTHALFTFNEQDRHGDLHVWLFPDSTGSRVGYVIFLREETFE